MKRAGRAIEFLAWTVFFAVAAAVLVVRFWLLPDIERYRGQIVAAGAANLRPVNVLRDGDEVVRRYLAGFSDNAGNSLTSFAVELVRRFGVAPPDDTFLVDFTRNPATLPVYSLADVLQCARGGDEALLRERFADRIVLIGTALDIEDRHLTARRFSMTGTPQPAAIGCAGTRATSSRRG